MRLLVLCIVLALAEHRASAQPADCVASPQPTATIPMSLNLQGLPGVPAGLQGYLEADVPVASPGGTLCASPIAPAFSDVLAGPRGDVLRGEGPRDLLRGPVPRVEVERR